MLSMYFKVNEREFKKAKLTYLQRKLKKLLKCFVIFNFKLNPDGYSYSFQKRYSINNLKIDDKTINTGFYTQKEIPDTDDVIITINVH